MTSEAKTNVVDQQIAPESNTATEDIENTINQQMILEDTNQEAGTEGDATANNTDATQTACQSTEVLPEANTNQPISNKKKENDINDPTTWTRPADGYYFNDEVNNLYYYYTRENGGMFYCFNNSTKEYRPCI